MRRARVVEAVAGRLRRGRVGSWIRTSATRLVRIGLCRRASSAAAGRAAGPGAAGPVAGLAVGRAVVRLAVPVGVRAAGRAPGVVMAGAAGRGVASEMIVAADLAMTAGLSRGAMADAVDHRTSAGLKVARADRADRAARVAPRTAPRTAPRMGPQVAPRAVHRTGHRTGRRTGRKLAASPMASPAPRERGGDG